MSVKSLTIDEAAGMLKVAPWQVDMWCQGGLIPGERDHVTKALSIRPADLAAFIREKVPEPDLDLLKFCHRAAPVRWFVAWESGERLDHECGLLAFDTRAEAVAAIGRLRAEKNRHGDFKARVFQGSEHTP